MKLLRNSSALLIANLATSVAHYAMLIIIARGLGSDAFGSYIFGTTFSALFVTIPNFGLDRIVIREVSRKHQSASQYLVAAGVLRLVLAVIALLSASAIAYISGYSPDTRRITFILGIALTINLFSELLRSLFFAFQAMPSEAFVRSIGRIITVLVVAIAVYLTADIVVVSWLIVGAALLEVALYGTALLLRFNLPPLVFHPDLCRSLIRAAFPLAMSTILVTMYFRVNVIILTTLKGEVVAGWFGAAFTFLQLSQFISAAIIGATLPALSQQHFQAPQRLHQSLEKVSRYLLLLVLPFAVLLSYAAYPVIVLMYGPGYEQSAQALQILVWASIFMFLGSLYATVLIAAGTQGRIVGIYAVATIISIGANLVLIPQFSVVGASFSTVITEAFVAGAFFWLVRRTFPAVELHTPLFKPVVAATIMGLLLTLLGNGHWIIVSIFAIAVYAGVSLTIGAVPREDTARIVALIKSRELT